MQAKSNTGSAFLARARRLARRYGTGYVKAGVAVLLVACVAVFAAFTFGGAAGGATTIERASGNAAASGESASEPNSGEDGADASASAKTTVLVVHVDGAVASPGVYSVSEGSRVNDAVLAAGGLAEDADTSTMNLASPLADGAKVHVPTSEELAGGSSSSAAGVETGSSSGVSSTGSSGLVNLNTATSSELQTLSGVGVATAAAIIEDREANGPFTSTEDLMRVSGIGEKKFAKIKDHVCV